VPANPPDRAPGRPYARRMLEPTLVSACQRRYAASTRPDAVSLGRRAGDEAPRDSRRQHLEIREGRLPLRLTDRRVLLSPARCKKHLHWDADGIGRDPSDLIPVESSLEPAPDQTDPHPQLGPGAHRLKPKPHRLVSRLTAVCPVACADPPTVVPGMIEKEENDEQALRGPHGSRAGGGSEARGRRPGGSRPNGDPRASLVRRGGPDGESREI
jgi:hypothetical protein